MNGFLCCLRLSDLTVNVYDFVVIWSLSKRGALVLNVLFTAQCVNRAVRSLCFQGRMFIRHSSDVVIMSYSTEFLMVGVCPSPQSSLKWGCGYLCVFSGRMIASWNCSSRTSYKTISIQYRSHTLSVTMAWPLVNTSVVMFLRRE